MTGSRNPILPVVGIVVLMVYPGGNELVGPVRCSEELASITGKLRRCELAPIVDDEPPQWGFGAQAGSEHEPLVLERQPGVF